MFSLLTRQMELFFGFSYILIAKEFIQIYTIYLKNVCSNLLYYGTATGFFYTNWLPLFWYKEWVKMILTVLLILT